MNIPSVEEASLLIYEKSANHHHRNEEPETDFTLQLFALPERLGVRVTISDKVQRGALVADVAVVYEWDRPATPDDDLDQFVAEIAIPQVLACASTVLVEAATTVGTDVPFYGIDAVDKLRAKFHARKTPVSELLANRIRKAKRASKSDDVDDK
jgi:hypothetical protein